MKLSKLDFEYSSDITVINKEQFEVHMRLYEGYINKINQIDQLLSVDDDLVESNATYSKYRGIKRGETFALNGVILHELYFQNIGNGHNLPNEMFVRFINRDFGCYHDWKKHFVATAKASRGWAVLAFDWRSLHLRNISLDAHDIGNIVYATPILVLDMYEHAYYLQYADKKDIYIHNFMININWDVVGNRINL